jgi:predicted PolB exonuclease-like 3'-5' exonuclease
MLSTSDSVAYFVVDVETAVDGHLVSAIRYPSEGLAPEEAVARYGRELLEQTGREFIPHTYHIPICIVVGKVAADFRLLDLPVIDSPRLRSHVMTQQFWQGWQGYTCPTLVTFNGRSFDLPVLELAAFRYGIAIPRWFKSTGSAGDSPRTRYNQRFHVDLMELLTNFGASRFAGGLDLAATLLGKPGKIDVRGDMVQKLYEEGRSTEISDYCRCDVLDTYFVFLRSRVLLGQLSIEREQQLVADTKRWLAESPDASGGIGRYLANWGDWPNPWVAADAAGAPLERPSSS